MLTRKQHELLMFIHERIKETGVSPSFDEMKDALDLASKSGIHRLITALEERGFLRRLPHRARALGRGVRGAAPARVRARSRGAGRGRCGFVGRRSRTHRCRTRPAHDRERCRPRRVSVA
jgi:hypothetical protein